MEIGSSVHATRLLSASVPPLLNNHSPSLLAAVTSPLFVQLLDTGVKHAYSRDAGAAVTPNMPPLIPN